MTLVTVMAGKNLQLFMTNYLKHLFGSETGVALLLNVHILSTM